MGDDAGDLAAADRFGEQVGGDADGAAVFEVDVELRCRAGVDDAADAEGAVADLGAFAATVGSWPGRARQMIWSPTAKDCPPISMSGPWKVPSERRSALARVLSARRSLWCSASIEDGVTLRGSKELSGASIALCLGRSGPADCPSCPPVSGLLAGFE